MNMRTTKLSGGPMTPKAKHHSAISLGVWVVLILLLAACSGEEDTSDTSETAATPVPQGEDASEPLGGSGASDESAAEGDVDLQGQTVEVIYPFAGDDEVGFQAVLTAWAEERGVELVTESTEGQPLVEIRVESGNPPDVAITASPSRLQRFYDGGDVLPLSDIVDLESMESSLIGGLAEIGQVDDGTVVAVPFRVSPKSLVWYPEPEFSDAGYEVPQTWDEMMALAQQIREDGTSPWCIGIESGGASGWPATDWLEEIMLRTAGPEVYDQWVSHEIPFDAPEVVNAAEMFADLAFEEGFVRGGRQSMVTTSFSDAPQGLFNDPPDCYLHRQATFITSSFPEDVQADLSSNVGVFPFPDIDPEFAGLVMGGGDYAALFSDNPAALELVKYLATPEAGRVWAEQGGYLSPHTTFDTALYPDDITRDIGQQLADAEGFRFDGSDLMTPEIGAGAFWSGMTSWVNGTEDLQTTLSSIESDWAALE